MFIVLPSVKLMSASDLMAEFIALQASARLTEALLARRALIAREIDRRIAL